MGVGGRYGDGQRDAGSVGQRMDLGTGLAAVDGVGASQGAPFFDRTDAPSKTARDQSIKPSLPSSSKTARWIRGHKPSLVHSVNRRCAVGTLTPKDGGRCRHAHPLVNTNTIAVNTARSSVGALPPPCGRTANRGINGSTSSHNSSGTRRLERSSTTQPIMHQPTENPYETRS